MPTFAELVEARAKAIYNDAIPGKAWEELTPEEAEPSTYGQCAAVEGFRRMAREALFLEWAEANPVAAGRLIEGRAAVVPFPDHFPLGPVPEIDAKIERAWRPLVTLTRLDSPFIPK